MSMSQSHSPRRPTSTARLVILTVLLYATAVLAATTDTTCTDTCADWSVTLGHCRETYGNLPEQQNASFANGFVDCLCVGWQDDAEMGTEAMAAAAGTCLACEGTPAKIKSDLSTFLTLCTIEAQNGSAAAAMTFAPVGYTLTSSDDSTSAAGPSPRLGMGRGAVYAAAIGSVVAVLAGASLV